LRSAVETVSRVEDPAQQRRLMGIILDDIQRLNRLISDISDASRLDAELSRARFDVVDLRHILTMLAELHTATHADDPAAIRVVTRLPARPMPVRGIEGRLTQIFRNLIANATSFSPPQGCIRLELTRNGDTIEIAVSDDGPGIPPDKLEAIFDRFYTARPQGEKFGLHSGLGLSISRQIAEAHGGTLKAENRIDAQGRIQGARFVLRLPVAHD
jgi:two-component system sensor histidine kinase ChvG